MKLSLIPACLLALLPAGAGAASAPDPDAEVTHQELKRIGILPGDKQAMRPEDKIDTKRPNPFAERAKAKPAKAVESVETEEIKIRKVFDTLKISGITRSGSKHSALLGDLILEEGAQLPPVIAEQTQILRVTSITDKMVKIAWVEGAGLETVVPRQIIKKVELSPRVGVLLAAQPSGTTDLNAYTYLDENGKVVWPDKMAPSLDSGLDPFVPGADPTLEASVTPATLPGAAGAGTFAADVSSAPENAASQGQEAQPRLQLDPAMGVEDPVQPEPEVTGEVAPAGN